MPGRDAARDDTGAAPGRARPVPTARRSPSPTPDLAEVRGQQRRAARSRSPWPAAMGCCWPARPGVGKTLLARTIPGLLPPLDDAAALSVTVVASAAGEGPINALRRRPPFRAPHHTLSYAAAWSVAASTSTPGEVTRADHGVLFLDELAEFDRDVLEALRQPLEEGRVTSREPVARPDVPGPVPAGGGHEPVSVRVRRHRAGGPLPLPGPLASSATSRRVSGPLRDRIDLWIDDAARRAAAPRGGREPESSAVVAPRIAAARAIAIARNRRRAQRAGCAAGTARGLPPRPRGAATRSGARRGRARPAAAARNACSGWLGRSRTSPDRSRSRTEHLDEAAWHRARPTARPAALAS